jgi:hypothetical protein
VIAQAGAAHPDAFAVDLVSATPRPARLPVSRSRAWMGREPSSGPLTRKMDLRCPKWGCYVRKLGG